MTTSVTDDLSSSLRTLDILTWLYSEGITLCWCYFPLVPVLRSILIPSGVTTKSPVIISQSPRVALWLVLYVLRYISHFVHFRFVPNAWMVYFKVVISDVSSEASALVIFIYAVFFGLSVLVALSSISARRAWWSSLSNLRKLSFCRRSL